MTKKNRHMTRKRVLGLFTRMSLAVSLVVTALLFNVGGDQLNAVYCGPGPGNVCQEWEICLLGFCVGDKKYWTPGDRPCACPMADGYCPPCGGGSVW